MDKTIWLLLVSNLSSVIAICGAIYLASRGKSGWGWLIFAAMLMGTTISTNIGEDSAPPAAVSTEGNGQGCA